MIDEYGPYDIVIGETDEGADIILWVLGSIPVYARQFIEDPLGRRIIINRNDRHVVKVKTPTMMKSSVRFGTLTRFGKGAGPVPTPISM